MQISNLEQALADLAHEVRLLGDRIRSAAPAPLDEFGRAAKLGALGVRRWAPGGREESQAWGSRLGTLGAERKAITSPDQSISQSPDQQMRVQLPQYGGSRTLRKLEQGDLGDWISSEVLAYDRKELRDAMAKLRGMLRKLLEDTFKHIVEGLYPSKGLSIGPWALGGEVGKALGIGVLGKSLGVGPLGGALGFHTGVDGATPSPGPIRGVDGFLDYARNDIRPESEPLTSHDSPLTGSAGPAQDIHFHIHDAAAVGPILRNKNAMLVRTAALVDRQRAVTRRPRGR